MSFVGAGGAFIYTFLTTLLLQKIASAGWVGGVFFPVILIFPIILVLVRRRSPILKVAVYSLIALLGCYAGYAVSLLSAMSAPYRSFALLEIGGLAVYDVPALAAVIAITALAANARQSRPSTIGGKTFSFAAAWIALIAVTLIGASYAFGAGARSCGGLEWGYLSILYIPLYFYVKPILFAAPLIVFISGGLFPRYLLYNQKITAIVVLVGMFIAGLVAFLATAPVAQPCSAL